MRMMTITLVVTLVTAAAILSPLVDAQVDDQPRCLLAPVTGMCRGHFRVWYYDAAVNNCFGFVYGGCGGNDNKFDTYDDCMTTCSPPLQHNIIQ